MKFLREPLLHFLLIGAAFFLLYGVFSKPVPGQGDKTITVSAAEIGWLQSTWKQRWNRLPTAVELDGLEPRWNDPENNDPTMKRSFDEYLTEAVGQGWWGESFAKAYQKVEPRKLLLPLLVQTLTVAPGCRVKEGKVKM